MKLKTIALLTLLTFDVHAANAELSAQDLHEAGWIQSSAYACAGFHVPGYDLTHEETTQFLWTITDMAYAEGWDLYDTGVLTQAGSDEAYHHRQNVLLTSRSGVVTFCTMDVQPMYKAFIAREGIK